MKNKIIYGIALIAFSIGGFAQVKALKIGDNPGSIDPSAALEIASTTKGLLPPRMTNNQMTTIATPVEGLVVYCTDCVPVGMYLRSGGAWSNLKNTEIPDATTTVKGKIQLAGDLAGTADAPVIANNAITTDKIANSTVTAAKLNAESGAANRILRANAVGDVTYGAAPFSAYTTVEGSALVTIRGNSNYTVDAVEIPYYTATASLTKGLYMYVNKNAVYHDVKPAANTTDVEAAIVEFAPVADAGTITTLSRAAVADAGTYKYAVAGQSLFFEVTSDTATVKIQYRPRVTDDTQSAFKMLGSAFGGNIYKIY